MPSEQNVPVPFAVQANDFLTGFTRFKGLGYTSNMSSIEEIENAIRGLPSEQLAELRAWFAEFDAAAWDRQFENDVAEGRLDALADEALREHREGRTTEL
jgi:hypothetical protein